MGIFKAVGAAWWWLRGRGKLTRVGGQGTGMEKRGVRGGQGRWKSLEVESRSLGQTKKRGRRKILEFCGKN